jgi:Tfp pilus assembly protein PilX
MRQAKTGASNVRLLLPQRGMTLLFALIALIAMALTGVALIRSVQTNNLISGNFAFRSAALQASDLGVEKAFTRLQTITSGSLDAKYPSGCTNGCNYYPLMQTAVDAQGIPSAINWSNVTSDVVTVNGDYTVRYVIDRLCTGKLPVTDLVRSCYSGSTIGGGTKTGKTVFSSTNELYFRVTVRVEGPRNTVAYIQTIIAH